MKTFRFTILTCIVTSVCILISTFTAYSTNYGKLNDSRPSSYTEQIRQFNIVKQRVNERYTTFYVTDRDGNTVFSPMNQWKSSSVKKIAFSSGYNIVIISSDNGKTEYFYKNGTWVKR